MKRSLIQFTKTTEDLEIFYYVDSNYMENDIGMWTNYCFIGSPVSVFYHTEFIRKGLLQNVELVILH